MRNISFLTFIIFFSFGAFAQTPQQLDNQYAFAKTFGYLKYFYPGDEAAKIDWDKFAFYGAQKVENCKNAEELKKVLNEMVVDLMPGVKVLNQADAYKFDEALLKPKNLAGFDVVSWQHLGVGLVNDKRAPYQSARTNRAKIFTPKFTGFGNAFTTITDEKYAGKSFVLTGKAKLLSGSGDGYFWFRVDKVGGKIGFFDNMGKRPIKTKEWTTFTIQGKIDKEVNSITFGAYLVDLGKYAVDDISLKIDGLEVYNTDFEKEQIEENPTSIKFNTGRSSIENAKYTFTVKEENKNKYLLIESPLGAGKSEFVNLNLFKKHANFGEYAEKPIGSNLKIIVPLALYGTKKQTYPNTDSLKTSKVLSLIQDWNYDLDAKNSYFKLGNIINTWNVFQHFYPYFDVAKTDWDDDLKLALKDSYKVNDGKVYLNLLKKLTAKLKDGHINLWYTGGENFYFPPFAWKWAGKDLVITSVLDDKLTLKKGDVVTKVNGKEVNNYFIEINENISAATEGYLKHRSNTESLIGEKDTPFSITLENGKELSMIRNMYDRDYYPLLPKQDTIKSLANNITYISISNVTMKMFEDTLPLLQKSKSIIFDLRGRTNENVPIIQYLMTRKDTSSKWMQIPRIIYPDQESLVGYENLNWGVTQKSPHLNAKIFFLIDGQAISAAESFMSFIEHYKLATIIGQPTAGTNGNVNTLNLPGGYGMRFTGMKVLKHNGSQHHGIGIIPNIFVEQTLKGIKEGRDEILERAIAEALK